ncbi:hypothetical protein FD737_10110 [Pantoea sp. Seng]|uniref:hypothetical protein n=1 Tax=Pantoea sp. Seng TaxID=2576761 RepID=UPI001321CD90|nr:hypothetical protein [Pantoea sp. Seng]MXP53433.1 hypothetical protein [Pantoea sp. Seng]
MEAQNKILFAYPVTHKDDMTKEDMCIPSPFFTGLEQNTICSIVVTVGYSIIFGRRSYILINVYKSGENDEPGPIIENGRVETLKGGIFQNKLGIFLASFHMQDFEVKSSGYYEISVKLFEADEEGNKTDKVLDSYCTQFYVQTKVKPNA